MRANCTGAAAEVVAQSSGEDVLLKERLHRAIDALAHQAAHQ